jgi:phosphoribosylformimino-5-aminoimidazole carboxamide ribotide isomerase
MTLFNVIPAIDLLDEKVVRLKQGRYDDTTFYDYTPVDLAKYFEDSGAKRIHIVDLNGARDGSTTHHNIIEKICKNTSLKIEVGGGIRTKKTASFYLDCGVHQIILGSLLVDDITTSLDIINTFSNQVIAGIDAKSKNIATAGWETTSSITIDDLLATLSTTKSLHSIIYTDISKDGMMQGPNLKMLEYVAKRATHPIIASGGIRNTTDIEAIKAIPNISGCIIGKAILNNLSILKPLLKRT